MSLRLCYRGIRYNCTLPNVEITEGEIAGKYRGTVWRWQYLKALDRPSHYYDRATGKVIPNPYL
ncbi:MAG: DUF4278 domain-containing protein [Cyanothece sp. SIO1E1]|nr:DUF4278 domain-containing protein [Cyanothece sp. SIO1E1]